MYDEKLKETKMLVSLSTSENSSHVSDTRKRTVTKQEKNQKEGSGIRINLMRIRIRIQHFF